MKKREKQKGEGKRRKKVGGGRLKGMEEKGRKKEGRKERREKGKLEGGKEKGAGRKMYPTDISGPKYLYIELLHIISFLTF